MFIDALTIIVHRGGPAANKIALSQQKLQPKRGENSRGNFA